MESERVQSSECYINVLPTEILAIIFQYHVRQTRINGKKRNRNTHSFLRVCRKWREVAQEAHCLNTIYLDINSNSMRKPLTKSYQILFTALGQFIQRCILIGNNGLVDLTMNLSGEEKSIFDIVEGRLEKLPGFRTYSESNGEYGIFLDMMPRLREEQYTNLIFLDLMITKDFDPELSEKTMDGRVLLLPGLKTLRLGPYVRPDRTLPHLDCTSLTTLILAGCNVYTISFSFLMEWIFNYPLLQALMIDADLGETSVSPKWKAHEGVQRLVIGGYDLFSDPQPWVDEWISMDMGDITSFLPSLSILTLKEISLMGCGAVRAHGVRELNLLGGSQLIRGHEDEDLSSKLRQFFSSLPNLRVLRLRAPSPRWREEHIHTFAHSLAWLKAPFTNTTSKICLIGALTDSGTGDVPALSPNLELIELYRVPLEVQVLLLLTRCIALRSGSRARGDGGDRNPCIFKLRTCYVVEDKRDSEDVSSSDSESDSRNLLPATAERLQEFSPIFLFKNVHIESNP